MAAVEKNFAVVRENHDSLINIWIFGDSRNPLQNLYAIDQDFLMGGVSAAVSKTAAGEG